MNFFERQAAVRQSSLRMASLLALSVLGVVIAANLAVTLVLAALDAAATTLLWALACATALVLGVVGIGSLYRMASLRRGGDVLAQALGGVPVPERSNDPQLRRLRSVVEALAFASAVPMPRLYVLEHEPGINAFAAGYGPADAAVAVTRGALERLNREELRAAIAQAFERMLDGEMRLNLRLSGALFGVLMPALAGRKILADCRDGAREGVRERGAGVALGLVAMALGGPGLLLGRLIKAEAGRHCRRGAGASAQRCARQAAGLAGALKKIAALPAGARLECAAQAEDIGPLLFGDGVGLRGALATHPPLLPRIRALEPGFRSEDLAALRARWAELPPYGLEEDARLGLISPAVPPLPPANARVAVQPARIAAHIGRPMAEDDARAAAILGALPLRLRELAGNREDVVALVLALLLDDDARVRASQHEDIALRMGRQMADLACELRTGTLLGVHPMLRLPLAQLAFPVLRQRPRADLGLVLDTVHAAAHADARIAPFEYCLGALLEMQLREALDPGRTPQPGHLRIDEARPQIAALLALIARAGHRDAAAAERAYSMAMQALLPHARIAYAPAAQGMPALDALWPRLDLLGPSAKALLVEALAIAIAADGRLRAAEAELLRATCALLHCPLPPVVEWG